MQRFCLRLPVVLKALTTPYTPAGGGHSATVLQKQ